MPCTEACDRSSNLVKKNLLGAPFDDAGGKDGSLKRVAIGEMMNLRTRLGQQRLWRDCGTGNTRIQMIYHLG
jgi:hypothetical protein